VRSGDVSIRAETRAYYIIEAWANAVCVRDVKARAAVNRITRVRGVYLNAAVAVGVGRPCHQRGAASFGPAAERARVSDSTRGSADRWRGGRMGNEPGAAKFPGPVGRAVATPLPAGERIPGVPLFCFFFFFERFTLFI